MSAQAPFDIDKAHRWFGVEFNNAIFPLLAKEDRSDEETERMIGYAHAALLHWEMFSGHGPVNTVRGLNMIATAYAYAARPEEALHYAQLNLDLLDKHAKVVADFDLCYGLMAMARALACDGQIEEARNFRDRCAKALEAVMGEQDKKICKEDYIAGPWYGLDQN